MKDIDVNAELKPENADHQKITQVEAEQEFGAVSRANDVIKDKQVTAVVELEVDQKDLKQKQKDMKLCLENM